MPNVHGRDLARLSNAIVNAISRSEEVKGLLSRLQEKGVVLPEDVFALRLQFLFPGVLEARLGRAEKDEERTEVQGDDHSVADDDLCASSEKRPGEDFDEAAWLRRARIRWDEGDE